MKIAIIREGKVPPDHRMPLAPLQCKQYMTLHKEFEFIIQQSEVRCVADSEFEKQGLRVLPDISEADLLMGIKEVPIDMLIPNKTYMFFSHTMKKQAYNRGLLQAILAKNIRLIDYECLVDDLGARVVAFGRFAGIVGAYNGILTYGKRFGLFDLKPAYACVTLRELKKEFAKIKLPPIKIILTGTGRVGKGSKEMLDLMHIKQVFPQEFLQDEFDEPVYTILRSENYYKPKNETNTQTLGFYQYPENYETDFLKFAQVGDLFISGHYWNPKAMHLFTIADMQKPDFKIKVIADVTCDIGGSIPSTIRASKITDPAYNFNPATAQEELAYAHPDNITVMAVDNLPCELPADASEAFGEQLLQWVFPALLNGDIDGILERATVTKNGQLTPRFAYLQDYVDGQ
jgi:saccharopine dehydrogenase (NAD+, L-lysine forming)